MPVHLDPARCLTPYGHHDTHQAESWTRKVSSSEPAA